MRGTYLGATRINRGATEGAPVRLPNPTPARREWTRRTTSATVASDSVPELSGTAGSLRLGIVRSTLRTGTDDGRLSHPSPVRLDGSLVRGVAWCSSWRPSSPTPSRSRWAMSIARSGAKTEALPDIPTARPRGQLVVHGLPCLRRTYASVIVTVTGPAAYSPAKA